MNFRIGAFQQPITMSSRSYAFFTFITLVSLMGLPLAAWKVSRSMRSSEELGRGRSDIIDPEQKALK